MWITTIKISRTALLFSFLLLMLAGCYWMETPAKERDFDASDLFLPLDLFPENWQEVGEISPMGPDSPIGIGDPDDAYIAYKVRQGPNNISYYYVYKNNSEERAKRWFDTKHRTAFSNSRVSIVEPWHTPDELSYRSVYADRSHMACAVGQMVSRIYVCRIIAKYEEFGVEFHASIRDETLSLEEFNAIACHIDAMFVALLDLSKEPIDC